MRVLVVEGGRSREVELDSPRVLVGRARKNGLALADTLASREHCALEQRADGAWLVDLGSRNGTSLNSVVLRGAEARLSPGDRIGVGHAVLEILGPRAPADAAPPGGAEPRVGPEPAGDDEAGLLSRAALRRELERALASDPARATPAVALVKLDIDSLGLLNGLLGYRAGDALIASFAGTAAVVARERGASTLIARLDGGKLAALLPGATSADAVAFAESVRARVASGAGVPGRFTVSAGVATAPEHGTTAGDLLRRSEAALDDAKRFGRDRVAVASATGAGGTVVPAADVPVGAALASGWLRAEPSPRDDGLGGLLVTPAGQRALALTAELLAGDAGPEALLGPALALVLREVEATRGTIVVRDSRGELRVAAALDGSGQPIDPTSAPAPAELVLESLRRGETLGAEEGGRHHLVAPLAAPGEVLGVLWLERARPFGRGEEEVARAFGRIVGVPLRRAALHARTSDELEHARLALARRGRDDDGELAERFPAIVGTSRAARALRRTIALLGPQPAPVLVTGESGVGKELVARALHAASRRAAGPFVAESCAALPPSLLEAELFGVRRGAFTGADRDRPGLFGAASGGTLFLDEVGELPLDLQAKLLRALQEGEVRAVGDDQPRRVDVRLLSATNRDLARMVEEGELRADLFYRLAVLRIEVPPLRNRREDIPVIARHVCERAARELGREPPAIDRDALRRLANHSWPGNVRELENEIRKLVALGHDPIVSESLSPDVIRGAVGASVGNAKRVRADEAAGSVLAAIRRGETLVAALGEAERLAIVRTLEDVKGNRAEAARRLGLSRAGLYKKLERFGLGS